MIAATWRGLLQRPDVKEIVWLYLAVFLIWGVLYLCSVALVMGISLMHRSWKRNAEPRARGKEWVLRTIAGLGQVGCLCLSCSVLGVTIGLIGGKSRAPVAESVITGLVGVFGGLSTYWSVKKSQVGVGAACLIGICLCTVWGLEVGSIQRSRVERVQRTEHLEEMVFEKQLEVDAASASKQGGSDQGDRRRLSSHE